MKQSQHNLSNGLSYPQIFGTLLLQALAAVSVAQTPTMTTGSGNTTETDPVGTSVWLVVTEVPANCQDGVMTDEVGSTGTCNQTCSYAWGPATVNKTMPAPPSSVGTTPAFIGTLTYHTQITGTNYQPGFGYTFVCPIDIRDPRLAQSQALRTTLNGVPTTYTFTANAGGGQTNTVTVYSAKDVSTTALSVTPNPVTAYRAITLTASVSGDYYGGQGQVTFYDGSNALGTVALNTSNVATITTSAVTKVGTHPLKAIFSGDSSALSSTSPTVNLLVKLNVATIVPVLQILLH
jgi:hypothetical protein